MLLYINKTNKSKASIYLSLRFARLDVRVEVEAGRLHCARALSQVRAQAIQVALGGRFHLAERASERHHRAPQTQQLGMLLTKVIVERLKFKKNLENI
jgi:hypothetical protein